MYWAKIEEASVRAGWTSSRNPQSSSEWIVDDNVLTGYLNFAMRVEILC